MGIRKAIITGSIKYEISPLVYPGKDVVEISKALMRRCEFENGDITQIVHDDSAGDDSFMTKVEACCQKINNERTNSCDLVVFYYSGHGFYDTVKKTSCLQISDHHYITINEIISCITNINSKNKYIIIDACQSGGFSLMKQPKGKEERKLSYNSEGIYLLFGTTKELLAFEATMRDEIRRNIKNSFFTHFIIEALDKKSLYLDNTISIKVIDNYASKKTTQYTGFDQIPTASTQTSGYFPFGFWKTDDCLEDINDWKSELVNENLENALLSREAGIVDTIEKRIMKAYSDSNVSAYMFTWEKDLLSKLSLPAKDILSNRLNLINKKYNNKPLINGLISTIGTNEDKFGFLDLILDLVDIEINVNLKDADNQTALKEVLKIENDWKSNLIIYMLFQRGYVMSSNEESEILDIIAKNSASQDNITKLSMSLFYTKMNSNSDREKVRKIQNILLSLLSLKYNRVIGYKFQNLLALSNNVLNSYKDFSILYLRACKKYARYDELKTKLSFRKKEEQILEENPFQDSSYNDIIHTIFPEIFD